MPAILFHTRTRHVFLLLKGRIKDKVLSAFYHQPLGCKAVFVAEEYRENVNC